MLTDLAAPIFWVLIRRTSANDSIEYHNIFLFVKK